MQTQQEQVKLIEVIAKFFGVPRFKHQAGVDGVWVGSIMDQMADLGMMLAGGAINGLFSENKVNDLDFYVKSKEQVVPAQKFLETVFSNETPWYSSNATTFKRKSSKSNKVWTAQLITRFTGLPEEIMDWFDFTITQGVYDFAAFDTTSLGHGAADVSFNFLDDKTVYKGHFIFGSRFLQDIAKRRLVYLGKSKFPICAMYRTKKYQAKGYKAPGSTIMHIALAIVQLKIETYAELKKQLMGIDTMYLQGLLSQEKYNNELPVDYGQFIADAFEAIEGFYAEDTNDEDFVEL